MPAIGPISRRKYVHCRRALGFTGPEPGGRHEYMIRGEKRIIIPNPHMGDISGSFLLKLLKQAGVSRKEWERVS